MTYPLPLFKEEGGNLVQRFAEDPDQEKNMRGDGFETLEELYGVADLPKEKAEKAIRDETAAEEKVREAKEEAEEKEEDKQPKRVLLPKVPVKGK